MKFLLLSLCMAFSALFSAAQPFRINEVMSSNGGAATDIDGDTSDWIEFFNAGTSPVNLNGYGLSDKKDRLFQWVFPDFNVNPGEYLLVFASGKDRREVPVNWNTIVASGDDYDCKVKTPVDVVTVVKAVVKRTGVEYKVFEIFKDLVWHAPVVASGK